MASSGQDFLKKEGTAPMETAARCICKHQTISNASAKIYGKDPATAPLSVKFRSETAKSAYLPKFLRKIIAYNLHCTQRQAKKHLYCTQQTGMLMLGPYCVKYSKNVVMLSF